MYNIAHRKLLLSGIVGILVLVGLSLVDSAVQNKKVDGDFFVAIDRASSLGVTEFHSLSDKDEGKKKFAPIVFKVIRRVKFDEAIEKMAEKGYQHADLGQLVAFYQNPEVRTKDPIFALGSVHVNYDGKRYATGLVDESDGYHMEYLPLDGWLNVGCHFLVVKK